MSSATSSIFIAKASRVFVFGIVSILVPVYLAKLGMSPFYIGVAIAAVVGGNILSNVALTWFGNRIRRRNFLLVFSFLMFISGLLLFASTSYEVILVALFIGNISTTGTEAGPFQSIETGVLPKLAGAGRATRIFGLYNMVGYAASSLGALTSSIPYYFQYSINAFHLLFLAYGLVGLLLFAIYSRTKGIEMAQAGGSSKRAPLSEVSTKGRRDIRNISMLNFTDAFGGGFVSQSILSYWFYYVYHVSLADLGVIFLVVNVITAISTFGASLLAERLGNLRTMVYTHIVSNIFLISIPLAGSLTAALAFLFLRQSMSQMDVPTRQAFMAAIFKEDERVTANAITNTLRSAGAIFGGPISGAMIGLGFVSLPLFTGGTVKIAYDAATFSMYHKEAK